jgi:hypothetical protein
MALLQDILLQKVGGVAKMLQRHGLTLINKRSSWFQHSAKSMTNIVCCNLLAVLLLLLLLLLLLCFREDGLEDKEGVFVFFCRHYCPVLVGLAPQKRAIIASTMFEMGTMMMMMMDDV